MDITHVCNCYYLVFSCYTINTSNGLFRVVRVLGLGNVGSSNSVCLFAYFVHVLSHKT